VKALADPVSGKGLFFTEDAIGGRGETALSGLF
jgi:hypothetical protein